jgi:translocation and assembly module TamA
MAVRNFDDLPPSQRYFTGGDTSVRGYAYQALGPKDSVGNVIGGRYLAVASLEYEHPLKKNWSAAAFVDTGNAFSKSFDEDLKTGVGVGVRWQSPIGPVRIDIAHPLDDRDTRFRVHLRLGPDL